ncbi:hypothetical protein RUM44_007184 [Polyplax serrata]|uniref:Timeless n=1 Tax=Polyplax serrata TaxID=468196 RepID=A0ABR1B011_POLSC
MIYQSTCARGNRYSVFLGLKPNNNDFIPILINVKDVEVIDTLIRILVNLSVPIECLLPVDIMSKTDSGRITIAELNAFLMKSKESFVDPRTTRVIIDYMKKILEMASIPPVLIRISRTEEALEETMYEGYENPQLTHYILNFQEEKRKLTERECDSINNCLLLLRNVLHIPEAKGVTHCTIQNQIVWNLFVQNIDKVLIHLMTCEQKAYWSVTMVQLIAVMYKDQHVGTLQKLLNSWFEASLSESSEDNESNTSPQVTIHERALKTKSHMDIVVAELKLSIWVLQEQGSDSSPAMTSSDPTSDSSDTGGGGHKSTGNHEGSSGVPRSSSGTNECNKLAGKMFVFEEAGGGGGGGGSGGGCNNNNERKTNSQGATRKNKNSSKRSTDVDSGAASICSSEVSISSKTSSVHNQMNSSSRGKSSPAGQQQHNTECFSPEMSDCGYATQAENPELVSTSSNEEEVPQAKRLVPVHQKPHIQKTRYLNKQTSPQEKKELRRKKLIKRSKTTIVNIKAMAHHSPTNEDITQILKEFTVDFLLKAYGPLVQVLYTQLLLPTNIIRIDTSHFFWLVTYFLKFAAQLELDLEHVREVLTYDILSYLTYEGVNICESLEIESRQENTDLKPFLRRQHLVVTAIKEFIQATETYGKMPHLSSEDKEFLKNLQIQISSTDDLKCLFVLLLRQYNPNVHNKQYLQDLIVTNHMLLFFLESSSKLFNKKFGFSLIAHLKQFATIDIMRQYGILLDDFESNGEYVNDCVFTMMHHIGGDMNQVASLFQPSILKTFTQIWERDFQICDDWSDLIEYVIHRFISLSCHCPIAGTGGSGLSPGEKVSWTKEEYENLPWYFTKGPGAQAVAMSTDLQLYDPGRAKITNSSDFFDGDEDIEDEMVVEGASDEINYLREILIKNNRGAQLSWLQRLLIEVCYVKLVSDVNCKINYDPISKPLEPIPHYYSHLNQSIPIVSWNAEQADVLLLQPFQMLLHKLGFHLPADTGKVFARIPSFWTVDVLFSVAQKLGPIVSSELKFEAKYLTEKIGDYKKQEKGQNSNQNENHQYALPKAKSHSCIIKYNPFKQDEPETKQMSYLPASKSKDVDMVDSDMASVCSICETNRDSVASDLTRMCISDEEQVIST